MKPVVIDASALARIAFGEEGHADLETTLHGRPVHAPVLLKIS
jgi:predicted nucleic acid-binding protein